MVAAAAVSQIGQFEAEMSSDAFQLLGMAERGFLPKALGRRSKHDTPTVSYLPSALHLCVYTPCQTQHLIEPMFSHSCAALWLELCQLTSQGSLTRHKVA